MTADSITEVEVGIDMMAAGLGLECCLLNGMVLM